MDLKSSSRASGAARLKSVTPDSLSLLMSVAEVAGWVAGVVFVWRVVCEFQGQLYMCAVCGSSTEYRASPYPWRG